MNHGRTDRRALAENIPPLVYGPAAATSLPISARAGAAGGRRRKETRMQQLVASVSL